MGIQIGAAVMLPQPLAKEILQQYADVLRVGRINVNGSEVLWKTQTSKELQLQAFVAAFSEALRQAPSMAELDDETMCQALYCFCKSVSINYALSEILQFIRCRISNACGIRTCGEGGKPLVSYNVEVGPSCVMRVCVSWSG